MSQPSVSRMACCCRNGFWSCALLLTVAVALVWLGLIPLVLGWLGASGLQPAAVAALLSLVVGLAVLVVNHHPGLRERPLVAMLVAMSVRMIPLLTICLVVSLQPTKSEYASFIGFLVFFYLVTLAVETLISVQLSQAHHTTRFPVRGPRA